MNRNSGLNQPSRNDNQIINRLVFALFVLFLGWVITTTAMAFYIQSCKDDMESLQCRVSKTVTEIDRVPCKDGFQYYIQYDEGTTDVYFQCDTKAIKELSGGN